MPETHPTPTQKPPGALTTLALNGLIMLACAFFGYLGLQLAVPPGYATGIWVPSGIALGAVLTWGLRCLPGVFLGSLLIDCYSTSLNTGALLNTTTLLIGALIAAGATCQTLAGWFLVKRLKCLDSYLTHPQDILKFACLAAPLSCIVNALWANGALFGLGILPTSKLLLNTLTWWIGDSIGVLIFTPCFLILFATPAPIWRNRISQVLAPLCISFAVVIAVFFLSRDAETNRLRHQFNQIAASNAHQLKEWLKTAMHTTHATTAFLSTTQTIDRQSFQQFAKLLLIDSPHIQAIEWAPRVQDPARFEKAHQLTILQHHHSGPHGDAYPILYAYPVHGNEKAIGFNLNSETIRRAAIQEAISSKHTAITDPLRLVQSHHQANGILLFDPVYRNKELAGMAVVVLNVSNKMGQMFSQRTHQAHFHLRDITDEPKTLFSTDPDTHAITSFHHQHQITFDQASRRYTLESHATKAYVDAHFSWQVWTTMVGGLFFCVLMEIILLILYGQKEQIQQEVLKQTSKLQSEEAKNLLLLQSAGEGIFGVDSHGMISFANPAACKLLEYHEDEILGQSVSILHIKDTKRKASNDGAISPLLESAHKNKVVRSSEHTFQTKSKKVMPVEYVTTPIILHDEVQGAVIVFNDISKQRETKQQLEQLAHFDTLTGLPNRNSFLENIAKAFARSKRNKAIMAVCFFDLDNFKHINDSLGHTVGDELLKLVPSLLKPKLRDTDYLARLGGDEFGLIIESVQSPNQVNSLLKRYIELFRQPLKLNHVEVNTSISIGVALYPTGGKDAEELIKNADIAMYRAKESGKNTFAFFNHETDKAVKRQNTIETSLRQALQDHALELHYQPQIDAKTGKLFGVEALARWDQDALDTVTPSEFIRIAEDSGMIHMLGEWVLKQIHDDYESLSCLDNLESIAINISIREFERASFVSDIESLLNPKTIDYKKITLEITESTALYNTQEFINVMKKLHKKHLRFALDDFGIQYSSIDRLSNLPIDFIKIDQNFIKNIGKDKTNTAITKAIIELAHAVGAMTIAEGVETEAQSDFLKTTGCHYLQGFYYDKPMPLDELITKYKDNS